MSVDGYTILKYSVYTKLNKDDAWIFYGEIDNSSAVPRNSNQTHTIPNELQLVYLKIEIKDGALPTVLPVTQCGILTLVLNL